MAEKPIKFVIRDNLSENEIDVIAVYNHRSPLVYNSQSFSREKTAANQSPTYTVWGNGLYGYRTDVESLTKEEAERIIHSRATAFAAKMIKKYGCFLEDLTKFNKIPTAQSS